MIHFIHGFLGQTGDLQLGGDFQSHNLYELVNHKESENKFLELLTPDSIIMGYSMGGRWALKFCTEYNFVPKKLILLSAHYGLTNQTLREQRKKFEDLVIQKLKTQSDEDFLQFWNSLDVFSRDQMRDELPPISREILQQTFSTMRLSQLPCFASWIKEHSERIVFLYGKNDEKYSQLGSHLSKWGVLVHGLDWGHRLIHHPEILPILAQHLKNEKVV
ncbi:MAG: hypothetical protein QE271_03210 [Bacteriovoracaceae bacterium]|nr:hypothetical protein [Bacteriovoracaceae bacterium]